MRCTTYALKCMDKAGGFDNYILNTSDYKLASDEGSRLKQEMREAIKQQKAAGGDVDRGFAAAAVGEASRQER